MFDRLPMAPANILLALVFGRNQTAVGPFKPLFFQLSNKRAQQFYPVRHTCYGVKTRNFTLTVTVNTPFSATNRAGAIKFFSHNMRIESAGFFFPQ